MVLDIDKKEIYIKKTKETIKVNTSRLNHWKLPIKPTGTLHKEATNLVYKVYLDSMFDRDFRKHIVNPQKSMPQVHQTNECSLPDGWKTRLANKKDYK